MKKLLLLIIIAVMAKLNVLAADGGKTSVRQENKVLVLSSYFQDTAGPEFLKVLLFHTFRLTENGMSRWIISTS